MYVSTYTSRPVLRIKNAKTQKSGILIFTDAVTRFGKRLDLITLQRCTGELIEPSRVSWSKILLSSQMKEGLQHQLNKVAQADNLKNLR